MIDRVVRQLGRKLFEVPVGFKWFAPGLFDGSCCFGGEESAGASFLRATAPCGRPTRTARSWTCWPPRSPPHRQGPRRALPGAHRGLRRIVLHADRRPGVAGAKGLLQKLSPESVQADHLAGEPIQAKLTRAPGNNAPIGGLKVVSAAAGLRPGPPGRKTSTRSTPKASRTNRIWMRSSARRSRCR